MLGDKRLLLKKLYEYPEITNKDYLLLIKKKNLIINKNENLIELNEINNKIDLYNEKQLIINMIKTPILN